MDARLSAFSALGHRLSAAQTAKEAAQIIVDVADQLLGWDACWLDLYSPAEDRLTHVLNTDTVDGRRVEFTPKYNHQPPAPLARRAMVEGGQLVLKENMDRTGFEGRPFGNTARPSASLMFVPIRKGMEAIGVLSIQSYTPKAYGRQSLETLQALADHCGGALARIRVAEALQRRVEMESLVSRVSTRFANLSSGETGAAIKHTLAVIATFTSADRSCLFESAPGGQTACCSHQWLAEGIESGLCLSDSPLTERSSWWMAELGRSEAICIPALAALPPEARAEREFFDSVKVRSVVAVPLRHSDTFLGFLALSSVRREQFWIQEHISLLKSVGEIFTNALQHKHAAERILRLNRLYSVLSRINELIVRTPSLETLCEQACRIAVEDGLFRAAWVGMTEPGTPIIKIVAYRGLDNAFPSGFRLSAAGDVPEGLGPTGTAIREQRYDLCNDAERDPRMAQWRQLITEHGYRSIAAFPLKVRGRVMGALTLFDSEPYAFDDEEIRLLEQLSADLSFAIEHGGQAKQLRLQGAALESAANGVAISDREGVVSWVNPAFTRLTGTLHRRSSGRTSVSSRAERMMSNSTSDSGAQSRPARSGAASSPTGARTAACMTRK